MGLRAQALSTNRLSRDDAAAKRNEPLLSACRGRDRLLLVRRGPQYPGGCARRDRVIGNVGQNNTGLLHG